MTVRETIFQTVRTLQRSDAGDIPDDFLVELFNVVSNNLVQAELPILRHSLTYEQNDSDIEIGKT